MDPQIETVGRFSSVKSMGDLKVTFSKNEVMGFAIGTRRTCYPDTPESRRIPEAGLDRTPTGKESRHEGIRQL